MSVHGGVLGESDLAAIFNGDDTSKINFELFLQMCYTGNISDTDPTTEAAAKS